MALSLPKMSCFPLLLVFMVLAAASVAIGAAPIGPPIASDTTNNNKAPAPTDFFSKLHNAIPQHHEVQQRRRHVRQMRSISDDEIMYIITYGLEVDKCLEAINEMVDALQRATKMLKMGQKEGLTLALQLISSDGGLTSGGGLLGVAEQKCEKAESMTELQQQQQEKGEKHHLFDTQMQHIGARFEGGKEDALTSVLALAVDEQQGTDMQDRLVKQLVEAIGAQQQKK